MTFSSCTGRRPNREHLNGHLCQETAVDISSQSLLGRPSNKVGWATKLYWLYFSSKYKCISPTDEKHFSWYLSAISPWPILNMVCWGISGGRPLHQASCARVCVPQECVSSQMFLPPMCSFQPLHMFSIQLVLATLQPIGQSARWKVLFATSFSGQSGASCGQRDFYFLWSRRYALNPMLTLYAILEHVVCDLAPLSATLPHHSDWSITGGQASVLERGGVTTSWHHLDLCQQFLPLAPSTTTHRGGGGGPIDPSGK